MCCHDLIDQDSHRSGTIPSACPLLSGVVRVAVEAPTDYGSRERFGSRCKTGMGFQSIPHALPARVLIKTGSCICPTKMHWVRNVFTGSRSAWLVRWRAQGRAGCLEMLGSCGLGTGLDRQQSRGRPAHSAFLSRLCIPGYTAGIPTGFWPAVGTPPISKYYYSRTGGAQCSSLIGSWGVGAFGHQLHQPETLSWGKWTSEGGASKWENLGVHIYATASARLLFLCWSHGYPHLQD